MKYTLRTREQVLRELEEQGKTITQLARELGVSRLAVTQLLHGYTRGRYGVAHRIAVKLGIKAGTVNNGHNGESRQ
jgi:gp16 family phage-associated protein